MGEISYTLKAIIRTAAIINKSEIITVERPMATITPTAKVEKRMAIKLTV